MNLINPFKPSGISHPFLLDESISNLRVVALLGLVMYNIIQILDVHSVS